MNALLPDYHSNNKNQRQNIVRTREYQLSNVKFLEELGEGAFGNDIIIIIIMKRCESKWF